MRRGLIRLTCGLYCLLTAGYAFTSASAFTYQELIRPRMFGVGVFSHWHHLVYWPWLALLLADLRGAFRHPATSSWAWSFAATWTLAGVAITIHPPLPDLTDNRLSLIVGAVSLLPLVWAAALDHGVAHAYVRRQPSTIDAAQRAELEGRWLTACLAAAAVVTIVYAALTPMTMRGAFEPDLLTLGLGVGLLWSAIDHALIFSAAFLVVAVCARAVAGRAFIVQYLAVAVVLIAALVLIVQRTVCDALGLDGWGSALVAGSSATAIVSTWGALRLRRWSVRDERLLSPVDLFFSPPPPSGRSTLTGGEIVPFIALAVAAWGITALSRAIDWDFLLLRTGVLALWFATVSRVLRSTPAIRMSDRWLAVAGIAPLAIHLGAGLIEPHAAAATGDPTFGVRRVLDRYSIYNPTFRVADGMLRSPLSSRGQTAFMRFARANTALAADLPPTSLDFVKPLAAAPHPPNLFLFVVDSLRPDYLAAYNPAVTFTPRIAEFASDAVVFQNAFTRYGGTGLSLPAIWMGAVGPHKQYIKPFWPMNTLEKLLAANRYRAVMGVDVIMEQLLRPADPPIELDRGVRTMDYRLCRTLDELESKMPVSSAPDAPPIFGYSLPQDLHVSNIMSASVPSGESYPGFHAPYASRVRMIDRCFGEFVDFLKRHNLYDNSLVVLTSDHGEMLGEEGRWGHAYYLFPQILHVPLLVHLPRGALPEAVQDTDAISFLTDITPTVYAALGYRPRASNGLMGEPLIGADHVASAVRRRGDYVAAASYSAVYAVIRRNGRRVYIVDAIKGDEYGYDRNPAGEWRRVDVSERIRTVGQRLIREHLDAVRRVYHVPDKADAGTMQAAGQ